jgi:dTDP-glucose 4,6-dehydratase
MGKGINLLVTGGYGFIGYQFMELAKKSLDIDNIINIDNLTYAAVNAPEGLTRLNESAITEHGLWYNLDINQRAEIENILKDHDVHAVVNFAAETHVDNSIKNNNPFIHTNVNGTYNLLEAVKNVWGSRNDCKYIQVSTDEVYGHLKPGDYPFDEDTPYNPRNPYSATKAFGDQMTMAYGNTYDLNVVVSHCSNNYGPGQHEEKLIPNTIRKAINGQDIPVYGDGKQVRDWIYVTDHAQGIMDLLLGGCRPLGKHYCIGADNEIRNIDIVTTICELLDEKLKGQGSFAHQIRFVKDRPGHDRRYAINSSRMHLDFGWEAKMPFKEGLDKTVEHYLNKWYVKS